MSFRCLFLLLSLWGGSVSFAWASASISVATAIAPIKHVVERIGGDGVEVLNILPPNSNPVHYPLKPSKLVELQSVKAYFSVGLPFERSWSAQIQNDSPSIHWVDLRAGVNLRSIEEHGHDHDHGSHDEGNSDPHIWLSVRNMQVMAGQIQQVLSHLLPERAEQIQTNYQSFIGELEVLDKELSHLFGTEPARDEFFVFHPAWGYFADDYGLHQVALEANGVTPGPQHLNDVITKSRALGSDTVFAQVGFSTRSAQILASSIGAKVVLLDPMAEDWGSNMRFVGESIARALR